LRRISREQLARYPSVELRDIAIDAIGRDGDRFGVHLRDGGETSARRLVLATGLVDELPALDGLPQRSGRSVFNCPYCNGWEHRNQPLAVLGGDFINVFIAFSLVRWSPDLVLCTNGIQPDEGTLGLLDERNIALHTEPVLALEGDGNTLERITFAEGAPLARKGLFFHPPTRHRS